MKRFLSLLIAGLLAFAPIAQADLRASSGGFGPIAATSGSVANAVTGLPTLLAQSLVAVAAPADTTEDTLATITVPANTLGANGAVRLRCGFTFTNNGNSKTIRIRYSGAAGTIVSTAAGVTTQQSAYFDIVIGNRAATNSQVVVGMKAFGTATISAEVGTTSAADTTATTTIVLTGQKGVNTDTLQLEGYTAEVIH